MVDEGLAMPIGASKSSIARSNDVALSIPEFDVQLLERSFDDVQSEAGTEVAAANCWKLLPNEVRVRNAESLASVRRQHFVYNVHPGRQQFNYLFIYLIIV